MSRQKSKNIIKPIRNIEIISEYSGYAIFEEGQIRGHFDSLENAYQEALALCARLFDLGIPARVFQASTRAS